jgi:hypothetical protein
MTTALYVVAILAGLALVLALALCKASAKPTPPPPGSLQARADELRAREAVRTQHTVLHAEPIRRTPGGWRT